LADDASPVDGDPPAVGRILHIAAQERFHDAVAKKETHEQ